MSEASTDTREAVKELLRAKAKYWDALNDFEDTTGLEVTTEVDDTLSAFCSLSPSEKDVDRLLAEFDLD